MKNQHVFQKIAVFSLAAGLVMSGTNSWAQDENAQLRQQVQVLQNRVDQLENQLANKQAAPATPANNYYDDQWQDPFAQMLLMQQQMDRMMRQSFADTGFNPTMDMKQTPDKYIITMDVPGMDKNKLNVQAKNGMLTISGERNSEQTQNNKSNSTYSQEKSYGSFMQVIPLPEDAKKDQIDAHYKNGVLTVTVGREKRTGHTSGKITVQ